MAYSAIVKPQDYFNTKLYTGTGSNQSLTGVGFQPDLIWWKCRNSAKNHGLTDAVRGNTKIIRSNEASAESTDTTYIQSFDSDGTTIGSNGNINSNGDTFCLWNWKANGAGSANTDGAVTSTVSVNTTPGFSIVKWDSTGTAGINIGHGLGQKPAMIIAKCLNQSSTSWPVYHQSLGATKYVSLQATTAEATSATRWNNSEPTTTTFQTGSSGDIGGSDRTMIAYCFAEKQGYSKFGRHDGNGSDNGPFIYTGFKPAFVIIKSYSTNPWILLDNKRGSYNVNQSKLYPNDSVVENNDTSNGIDFLSNGLKIRRNNSEINASGTAYIYMAFAENPLVANSGTDGVPATAR
tara:strand:+ start:246 stop:1292 length:1047 start_codon:yes stop_codon:yes gene_type:complete